MKTASCVLATTFIAIGLVLGPTVNAQLSIPYADGSDLALNVTSNTNIDLRLAANGVWTAASQNPGYGTYDATQWAVVFKYSSVNIATNCTVTFSNHVTHAPVVWLVNGNVTINGNLSLDGQSVNSGTSSPLYLPEPGPGGFRGGSGVNGLANVQAGEGLGPGGGKATGSGFDQANHFGVYGNPEIVPLIGGSGGGGGVYNGGAGGGAILIAASTNITINGFCHAQGGTANASGSGGAIRLVANQILGTGKVEAVGGSGAGVGRLRFEATSVSSNIINNPATVGVLPANPPIIFPTNNPTSVTVKSVQGVIVPADPKAIMSADTGDDDISLVTTNKVTIQVETKNFPTNGTVTVLLKPRNRQSNSGYPITTNALFVSGNTNSALWQVTNVSLPYPDHTVIQARATY